MGRLFLCWCWCWCWLEDLERGRGSRSGRVKLWVCSGAAGRGTDSGEMEEAGEGVKAGGDATAPVGRKELDIALIVLSL